MKNRLEKIISFLSEIEKFKLIKRIPYLSDKKTLEDDAQHSWHLAMMLLVLETEFINKFDLLRALKLTLIHDLVEIYTGDDWVTTTEAKAKKRQNEVESANKLFPILPDDLAKELRDLWEEYDEGKTIEAKIAKGLDRLNYSLQYNTSDKINWFKEGDTIAETIDYAKPHLEIEPVMSKIMDILMSERAEKEAKGIFACPYEIERRKSKMKYRVKALIFDFDLTLVDSKIVSKKVAEELLEKHNISFDAIPESELWGGTFKINSKKAKDFNETDLLAEEIEALSIQYCMKHHDNTCIQEQDTLKEWQKDGMQLCIVSGNTKEIIESVLNNKHNNSIKFSAVYETNSGHSKAVRIQECINKLGIKDTEAIYIGDHVNDILAAKEAGVISCAITTGFHSRDEYDAYNPDLVVDSLKELKEYLQN
jgi:putative hydrolase of HD superfamily